MVGSFLKRCLKIIQEKMMAKDISIFAVTYQNAISEKTRKRNALIVAELDDNYETDYGNKKKIILPKLRAAGDPITMDTLNIHVRLFRDAFVYLSGQNELAEEKEDVRVRLARRERSTRLLEGLLADGFNAWFQIQELLDRRESIENRRLITQQNLDLIAIQLADLIDLLGITQYEDADNQQIFAEIGPVLGLILERVKPLIVLNDDLKKTRLLLYSVMDDCDSMKERMSEKDLRIRKFAAELREIKKALLSASAEIMALKTKSRDRQQELELQRQEASRLRSEVERLEDANVTLHIKCLDLLQRKELLTQGELDETKAVVRRKLIYSCPSLKMEIRYAELFLATFESLVEKKQDAIAKGIRTLFSDRHWVEKRLRSARPIQIFQDRIYKSRKLEWKFERGSDADQHYVFVNRLI